MNRPIPRQEILQLADLHGVQDIRIFGSVARDEATEASDLDLLVRMAPDRSLLDLIGFRQALEDRFGNAVDVVTDAGLSPYLRDDIIAEAVPL